MSEVKKSPGAYSPVEFEEKWYKLWEERGYFHANPDSPKPHFSVVIPPPNVTGVLHMGHALNNTLQDVIVRYKRMDGYEALWMVGTDHAGIATQNVVERKLAEENLTRDEVGREEFINRVWQWREKSGSTIIRQLKRLGASCDWERERFTMDEGLSRAVREVFCTLFEEGLIYKGSYIINWCPRCRTALADDEVEHETAKGSLWHLRYPLEDGSGEIIVATTRPETMLGDTAVAVNPTDERYAALIGKFVTLPAIGRKIPIIADDFVDPAFGTGAVKVTPAHDPNDFEMGLRHKLEAIRVIGEDGFMTAQAGPYAGLDRYEARKKLLADFAAENTLAKIDEHTNAVGGCYRCRTVIEPLVSEQWFVKVKPLAEKAILAVEKGDMRIVPSHWSKTYFNWMDNIRDWCISRQIWWGHRIPAFTCDACSKLTVARADPSVCPACGSSRLTQESDVLDTWFSSALWPFSTMGWPDKTPLLEKFYPTSLLVTGFDILFFWVARMMMMGIWFMKEVPFKDVYLHALLRDEEGRKMSKSLGNAMDPLELIDEFGADVLRFTLVAFAAQGRDIRLSRPRFEGYHRFANKIWNAARFIKMNMEDFDASAPAIPFAQLPPVDRWIITRLDAATDQIRLALDEYRFNDAALALYHFLWHEFCDWYVEMAKHALYSQGGEARLAAQQTLAMVFDRLMRLAHPFMPFLSEELWLSMPAPAYLGQKEESLVIARYPKQGDLPTDEEAAGRIDTVREVVGAVRNVRGEMNVPPARRIEVIVFGDPAPLAKLQEEDKLLKTLAGIETITYAELGAPKPEQAAACVAAGFELYLPLAGLIDLDEEKKRLTKEIEKLIAESEKIAAKLANPQFIERAPTSVVEKEKARAAQLEQEMTTLREGLRRVGG